MKLANVEKLPPLKKMLNFFSIYAARFRTANLLLSQSKSSFSRTLPSDKFNSLQLIIRCASVIGSSMSSLYEYVKGREFKTASISARMVDNSSNDNCDCPSTFFRQVVTPSTMDLKNPPPPHQGGFGKIESPLYTLVIKKVLNLLYVE